MTKDDFRFSLEYPVEITHERCLKAIQSLGWKIRHDLTRGFDIACYVSMPELLPQAPIYFISLYAEDNLTHVVLVAANDEVTQTYSKKDLPRLKAAIIAGKAAENSTHEAKATGSDNAKARGRCFISYRRYDSADVVGRIYDRLVAAYGADSIFKDVDNIPIGADFRKVLDQAVSDCAVLLVVIGRDWLTVTNENHQQRLDDPADFVRIEIESALKREIPVVPLLVREASMPRGSDMPESIQDLAYRNGIPIRSDPDFHRDVDRLIQALNQLL